MPPKNFTHSRRSFVLQGYLQENSIAVRPPPHPIPLFSVIISCLNSDSPTIFFLLLLTCQICLSVGSWVRAARRFGEFYRLPFKIFRPETDILVLLIPKSPFFIFQIANSFISDRRPHSDLRNAFQEMLASHSVTFPLWINYISDWNGGFFRPKSFQRTIRLTGRSYLSAIFKQRESLTVETY